MMSHSAAQSVVWHGSQVSPEARQKLLGHPPMTLWLTGLSAAGKSTLAFALERQLIEQGRLCYVLDGDNLRHGLNRDLGFSAADRHENIRRVAEVARLLNDAGLIVITAFISPYREDRAMARDIIGQANFREIYLDTPLAECEARDPKGLYRRARSGSLPDFTGIGAPYETPEAPDLQINTKSIKIDDAVNAMMQLIKRLPGDEVPASTRLQPGSP